MTQDTLTGYCIGGVIFGVVSGASFARLLLFVVCTLFAIQLDRAFRAGIIVVNAGLRGLDNQRQAEGKDTHTDQDNEVFENNQDPIVK